MSQALHWLSPGDPAQRTGGYIYNARMAAALRTRGWDVHVHALPGAWPWPCGADLQAARGILSEIHPGTPVVADGLLWPGLGAVRTHLVEAHPILVLVHSLLDKEGRGDLERLARLEDAALADADGWIATSSTTGRLVRARLGPAGPPGAVVVPGTDPANRAPGTAGHNLLCVATVTPRKGIRILVKAVAALEDPEWRLDIVGSLDRAQGYVKQVRADIEAAGLAERIQLHGECEGDGLEAHYQQADILVHAAHFEAFGMGLAEAIARCIPVVSTPAGALEILPAQAVQEVPAANAPALTAVLDQLLRTPAAQHRMGRAAEGADLPTWSDTAVRFDAVLGTLL